jgi:tetratricopeptide (TPR) repeat protein
MKKLLLVGLLLTLFQINNMSAQDLPSLSPGSMVKQTAGLTDVTITYSSPAVRERTIWGDLVPYDKMWRTGANSPTRINFTQEVTIGGKKLKAGEYAIVTIPGKNEWTVILSMNRNTRASNYKEEEDAARLTIKPTEMNHTERLTFWFSDYDNDKIVVHMAWEKLHLSFEVTLHTHDQAVEEIEDALGWRTFVRAGRYYYEVKEYEKALDLLNTSLEKEERWYTLWYRANVYHEMGKNKEAYADLTRAKELGDKDEAADKNFFFKGRIVKALETWMKK